MEREVNPDMITRRRLLLGMCGALGGAAVIAVGYETLFAQHDVSKPQAVEAREIDGAADLLEGQWQYLPSARKDKDGLRIDGADFVIVEQDGSLAMKNPAINLYGTRLNVTGDFALNLSASDVTPGSGMQLYGEVPIIVDEFRIERKSVRLGFDRQSLNVSVWDGSRQAPAEEQAFPLPAGQQHLQLLRRDGLLIVLADGEQLGVVGEHGIFDTGQLWFGADGSWLVSDLTVTEQNGGRVQLVDTSELKIDDRDPAGLQALARQKRPDFIIGGAVALGPLVADTGFARTALGGNLGSLTPENDMKMINLQPNPDVFDFSKSDAIVQLAERHDLKVHGHALVFGEANPPWFNQLPVKTASDKQRIQTIMRRHVATVVGHYKGRVASWDVINEPMADYDSTANGEGAELRQHKWQQAMGEAYIATALAEAHRADPDALLFINEYGLEADGDRWDAFVVLLERLRPQLRQLGVPLDKVGIGFQAHVYEAGDRIDPAVLGKHMDVLADMRFRTQVSEIDVYSDDGPEVQTQQFADTLQVCIGQPNCVAWRFWTWDRYDFWKDDDGAIQRGADGLWDTNMQPRPAIERIKHVLSSK